MTSDDVGRPAEDDPDERPITTGKGSGNVLIKKLKEPESQSRGQGRVESGYVTPDGLQNTRTDSKVEKSSFTIDNRASYTAKRRKWGVGATEKG